MFAIRYLPLMFAIVGSHARYPWWLIPSISRTRVCASMFIEDSMYCPRAFVPVGLTQLIASICLCLYVY